MQKRPRNRKPLLDSWKIFLEYLFGFLYAQNVEEFLDPAFAYLRRYIIKGREKLHILPSCQPPIKTSLISSDKADTKLRLLRLTRNVIPINKNLAFCRQYQTAQYFYKRGLSRAVSSYKTKKLPLLTLKLIPLITFLFRANSLVKCSIFTANVSLIALH